MSRRSTTPEIRLPDHEDFVSPVTIFDADGRVVRVVPAREFRATAAVGTAAARTAPTLGRPRRRHEPS
jgi:hypothetical protein